MRAFLHLECPCHPQRLIVSFPKMFHLATINIVDDWDVDARTSVARREFGTPEALRLDPGAYGRVVGACSDMHDVAKQVCGREGGGTRRMSGGEPHGRALGLAAKVKFLRQLFFQFARGVAKVNGGIVL
jgi:hypothetical protein